MQLNTFQHRRVASGLPLTNTPTDVVTHTHQVLTGHYKARRLANGQTVTESLRRRDHNVSSLMDRMENTGGRA